MQSSINIFLLVSKRFAWFHAFPNSVERNLFFKDNQKLWNEPNKLLPKEWILNIGAFNRKNECNINIISTRFSHSKHKLYFVYFLFFNYLEKSVIFKSFHIFLGRELHNYSTISIYRIEFWKSNPLWLIFKSLRRSRYQLPWKHSKYEMNLSITRYTSAILNSLCPIIKFQSIRNHLPQKYPFPKLLKIFFWWDGCV